MHPGVDAPGRSPWGLLRDPVLAPFLGGRLLFSCGLWVQNIAAAVLMFELTGSAFMVGTVSVLQFVGPLLLALWAGALTDRADRRKVLIAGTLLSATAVGFLALVVAALGTHGFGGPPVLLATIGVTGLGHALSSPAQQALVPALVPDEDLERALALNSAGPSIARAIGPALGAGLLVLGGPALAFGATATAYVAFVGILLVIRGRPQHPPRGRPRILGGLRYLVADRKAASLIMAIALVTFGADPVVTLTPSLAAQLGGGDQAVGAFASSFGLGAVILVVVFGRLRRLLNLRKVGVMGFWVLAAGLVLIAASPTFTLALPAFFLSGLGFMMATVALNTRVQRRVPDTLRGRVMALWAVAFTGSRPFAALLNGTVADTVSLDAALVTAALVVAGASLFARVTYATADPAQVGKGRTEPDTSEPR